MFLRGDAPKKQDLDSCDCKLDYIKILIVKLVWANTAQVGVFQIYFNFNFDFNLQYQACDWDFLEDPTLISEPESSPQPRSL